MSMTTIQYNDHNIHESFNYFSKLVHLPKIIQKSNIKKSHGIKSEPLFEWLLTTIFNRYSIFRRILFEIVSTMSILIGKEWFSNREFSKKTELLARVFDHDKQCYLKGFRALTIGWSDGNTFLPVNFALMSSSKTSNLHRWNKTF